jgi:hypothetical protein
MRRSLVTVMAAAVVVAATPAAALANSRTFRDQRGEVSSSNDIVRYAVGNGKRITATTWHRDLTRKALDLQLLLKNSRNGRVYTAYATLDGKADYVGQVGSGDYAPCPGLAVSRDLAKNTASLSVPRACLGSPRGRIKMRVRVQWSADGAKGDWAPNRGYSGWVAR